MREMAIIGGEEAGGESGAAGGAAAVGPLVPYSAGCGPAAALCAGGILLGGAIVGGVAGDTIGGKLAGRAFDKSASQMAPAEIERIKQQIRQMNSQSAKITVEDPSGPGSM